MTGRDRIVVTVLAVAAILGGFWFLVLSPKRQDASKLGDQLTAAHTRLQTAQQNASTAAAARARYATDYATVARLGKAVPAANDVPSLVYQLDSAATGAHIDFRSIHLTGTSSPSTPTPAPPAAQAAAINQVAQGEGSGGSAAPGSSATPAGASSQTAGPPSPTGTPTTGTPAGTPTGAAGFPTMPFSFVFDGSFFDMEKFMRAIEGFVTVGGNDVRVRGRLLTIDSFALGASVKGFPKVQATMSATAYLAPATQGATAGASPQSPSPGQTAPAGAASSTPPAAMIAGPTP